jgi:hypothetical protein
MVLPNRFSALAQTFGRLPKGWAMPKQVSSSGPRHKLSRHRFVIWPTRSDPSTTESRLFAQVMSLSCGNEEAD